jgi:hypothetical protein
MQSFPIFYASNSVIISVSVLKVLINFFCHLGALSFVKVLETRFIVLILSYIKISSMDLNIRTLVLTRLLSGKHFESFFLCILIVNGFFKVWGILKVQFYVTSSCHNTDASMS